MHRPIIVPPTIPSNEEAVLSPTELPFTADDFDPQLAASLELMPELLGDEKAGIRYAINGLISMTPDGHPLLGETPEVKGLWTAAASWIKEGPGCGRARRRADVGPGADRRRARGRRRPVLPVIADDRVRPRPRRRGRSTRCTASSTRAEQYESLRPLRTGPLYERAASLGAVFYETARWERPHWYASNEPLLEKYAGRLMDRPAEWESRWWSPVINAEHLAMRDCAGLVDLSAFTILDVTGPGALAGLQHLAVAQLDVPVGRTVYTPFLNDGGRLRRRPHRSCGSARATSVWSPARPTAGGTPSGSATGCRATRSSPTSARPGPRSGCGDPAQDVLAAREPGRGPESAATVRDEWILRAWRGGGARLADLLRGRVRLGAARARRPGRAPVGPAAGRRAAAWAGAGRHRRLRDDRAAGEGVPGVRGGAHPGVQPGRGRDGAAAG